MVLAVEHVLDLGKTEEVALSMQGGRGPQRPSRGVDVPCIDAEELGVAKLEDLLRYLPFELLRRQVSLPVQAVPVCYRR